jgi:hypothetical protein
MVKKHDSGDVKGLEEVFRSQEFSRMSETGGTSPGDAAEPGGRDDTLFKKMFGHAHGAVTDLRRPDDMAPDVALLQPASAFPPFDPPQTPGRQPQTDAAGDGGAGAEQGAAVSSDPWKRESSRYWTIAAVSALVALVVAGVTAGNGHHLAPHISAQGKQRGTARPHRGSQGSGAAATGPSAPGSLTGGIGAGALLLGLPSAGTGGSGSEPGGHVTLIGAATTTGTPFPSPSTPSGGSTGGGAGGAPPGLGGTDPVAPVVAGVGSTVATVGNSITGLTSQVGGTVPGAAPTASAVNGVVSSLDQAVSATTL